MTATRCPRRMRHWRVALGSVGYRTPVCVWCGSPNPKPLTEQEWADLIDWVEHIGSSGPHVRAAITDYQKDKQNAND